MTKSAVKNTDQDEIIAAANVLNRSHGIEYVVINNKQNGTGKIRFLDVSPSMIPLLIREMQQLADQGIHLNFESKSVYGQKIADWTYTRFLVGPQEHFISKIMPTDDCWYWTGQFDANGYARYEGRLALETSFKFWGGTSEWPNHLAHSCNNRGCVRITHIFDEPPIRSCGHTADPENTYVRPDNGQVECRECKAIRTKLSHERLKLVEDVVQYG